MALTRDKGAKQIARGRGEARQDPLPNGNRLLVLTEAGQGLRQNMLVFQVIGAGMLSLGDLRAQALRVPQVGKEAHPGGV